MSLHRCLIYTYLLVLAISIVNSVLGFIFSASILLTIAQIACFSGAIYLVGKQTMAFGDALHQDSTDPQDRFRRNFDEERHARETSRAD